MLRSERRTRAGHHGVGSIGHRIALLNLQPVERMGVIAHPALIEASECTEIRSSTAARAYFPDNCWMSGAQLLDNIIEGLHVAHIDLALVLQRSSRPACFGDRPVEVPFHQVYLVLR